MSRISKHIAQKYIDRLPDEEQYYKLSDLRSLGFPLFMIRRIQLEVERNLAESIVPPQTDWANMEVPAVQEAWDRFLNAIRSDARLPASYARSVLETVAEDIFDLLVQPRKNLPEIIFGSSNELSLEQVNQRVQAIVVYRHFATLISRYMERKELDKLTKDQCSLIVGRADEKLTRPYTPLNWAQMLEPLFTLLDEQIDSSLLHLFFEDKKMPRVARSFDLMNRSLNRAQLIEVLSSPELLNFEGYEEDQSDLFEGGAEHRPESTAPGGMNESGGLPKAGHKKVAEQPTSEATEPVGSEAEGGEEDGDPIVSGFHKSRTVPGPDSVEDEKEDSLSAIFLSREEAPESEFTVIGNEEDDEGPTDEDESLNSMFLSDEEQESADREDAEIEIKQKPGFRAEDRQEQEEIEEDGGEGGPELKINLEQDEKESDGPPPMWERFLDPEAKADMLEREEEDEEDDSVMDGFIEEPIIDLTEVKGPDSADLEQMHGLLTDQRTRFVEEIFRGSETAYEDAIRELAAMEGWRSASRYIEREVFKRNLVDMYSETAVDFTDRLQTYFIKAPKSDRS